tara:strand:- start:404 stop:1195 length:792 start_codon:yes stop_codon:yes gene_type:complete
MGEKILSICIPSLFPRKKQLNRLLLDLEKQIKINNLEEMVEILVCVDNGEITLGEKSNKLVNKATGNYITGIGDDDIVKPTYVKDIYDIAKNKKYDQITFIKECVEGKKIIPMEFSKKYKNYIIFLPFNIEIHSLKFLSNKSDKLIIYRNKRMLFENNVVVGLVFIIFKKFIKKIACYSWPTMVVKKDIVDKVKFTDLKSGQDMEWAINLSKKKLIKKEYNINKPLYIYNFNMKKSSRFNNNSIITDINHTIKPIDKKIIKFI